MSDTWDAMSRVGVKFTPEQLRRIKDDILACLPCPPLDLANEESMDMQTLRLESREGDRVRWVPTEAKGDPDSTYCSDGTISRFDGQRVMVKFDSAVEVCGFEAAQEVAIDPQTLRVLRGPMDGEP